MVDRTATDWATGVEHEDWPVRLVATRQFVINQTYGDRRLGARRVGRLGIVQAQPARAAVPRLGMGRFHPGNTLLAHELIGKLCLGINPDESPRWG